MRAHGFPDGKESGMIGRAFNSCIHLGTAASMGLNGVYDLMAVHDEWVCMGLASCWALAERGQID